MNKHLRSFKRITCILGISFLVMGMVPLPAVLQKAPAPATEVIKPEGLTLLLNPAQFGAPGLATGLLNDKSADGESCNGHGNCQSKFCLRGKCRTETPDCNKQGCPNPVNCVVSDWGPCSVECGGGTKTRTIIQEPQYGGAPCPALTSDCNEQACPDPVNCQGSWSCDATCGDGTETFTITVDAQHGGTCEASNGDTRPCSNLPPCDDGACASGELKMPNGECVASCPACFEVSSNGETCQPVTCSDPNASCQEGSCVCNQGYQLDAGACVAIPTDVCPNIWGVQETVPAGMEINTAGNCTPEGKPQQDHKVVICHVPEGNPENAKTKSIALSAWTENCTGHGPGCHGGDYLGACVGGGPVCGDDVVDAGEECDGSLPDGQYPEGSYCTESCDIYIAPYCGDNIVNTVDEECDGSLPSNGPYPDGSICLDNCTIYSPECGNGIFDSGEACDGDQLPVNAPAGAVCNANCEMEYCGDGIVQTTLQEACDDGNGINDDECSNECTIPTCGDGIWQEGSLEQCDGGDLPEDAPDDAVCNDICVLEYCGDGITNGEEDCDGEAWCTETCEIKSLLALALDPYCATKAGVGAVLRWEFTNPNAFAVPVSWTLDGAAHGPVMVGAGVTYFAGDTLDGPASHTLTAWIDLPGGPSESFTSSKECPSPGDGGTPLTAPIPVTGAGGPIEPQIIPVTGTDLSLNLVGLQKLFTHMGMMMFGITMVLEGVDKRLKAK